jgi:non-heme chloroperoxidase
MPYLMAEDGVPLYYTDEGEGDPLFLIHGWTMNQEFFRHNVPRLSRTHRVVTMDIRGHGCSGKQESNWTLAQAARDARRVMDHLDLNDATLVGWSMGTTLIFNYLDLFGAERLKGLVFVDMTPYLVNEGGWEHGVFGTLDLKAAYDLERDIFADRLAVQQGFVPACFKGGEAPDERTVEWWVRQGMITPTPVMAAFWVSMVAHDWRDLLPRTPVPVLLCYGADSAIYPTKVRDYMREQVPNAELVEFENSGHSPFWEEPERFNEEVARFAG